MKKFVIYEIRNIINNMIYVGIHCTENVNDNYMGSGSAIRRAIKENGIENFEKKILYVFYTKEEALLKEYEIVNEDFLKRSDVYNLTLGGGKFGKIYSEGFVNVKDEFGNRFRVRCDDPRYLSGELVGVNKGKILTKDENGFYYSVEKLEKNLIPVSKDKISVRNFNNKTFQIDRNDIRFLSGEVVSVLKNKVTVKDENNNFYSVDINDPRYLSGELLHNWKNLKHKEETKQKIGKANSIKQKGKNNSQFGKCWIFNDELNLNKSIDKKELRYYLSIGWKKGRKMRLYP